MTTSNEQNRIFVIVDDDVLVREGTKIIAESIGCTIVGEAADGLEAVNLSNNLRPDVILMDVNMPKMNGLEATRYCHGKVIIITACNSAKLEEEAQTVGAVTCLSKPIFPMDLEQVVTRAMAQQV